MRDQCRCKCMQIALIRFILLWDLGWICDSVTEYVFACIRPQSQSWHSNSKMLWKQPWDRDPGESMPVKNTDNIKLGEPMFWLGIRWFQTFKGTKGALPTHNRTQSNMILDWQIKYKGHKSIGNCAPYKKWTSWEKFILLKIKNWVSAHGIQPLSCTSIQNLHFIINMQCQWRQMLYTKVFKVDETEACLRCKSYLDLALLEKKFTKWFGISLVCSSGSIAG